MPFLGGLFAGGGSLLSGIFGSNAAQSAAQLQAQAAEQAAQIQQQEFQSIKRMLAPYRGAGEASLDELTHALLGGGLGKSFLTRNPMSIIGQPKFTMKDFKISPGYQWSLQQGENAIRSAGSPTGTVSGAQSLALQQYGVGAANQEYQQAYQNWINNYWNRYNAITGRQNQTFNMLNTLAGQGQNAAAQTGAFGQAAATNIGQDLIGAANAGAAGIIGSTQALTGGIAGGLNAAALIPLLQQGGFAGGGGGDYWA